MEIRNANSIFHVHTYRCGHAEMVPDEAYVKKAIELGVGEIWFSDHAPFPGDPFRSRMKYDELKEYTATLAALKEQYRGIVTIHCGLESEYIPSHDRAGYYRELKDDPGIEFLILGQHMAEIEPGEYTFALTKEELQQTEYRYLSDAIVQGCSTGYFDYVAHPDRIYRRRKQWDADMESVADTLIQSARQNKIPLELNMHSLACKHYYWPEFWNRADQNDEVVIGLDAHTIDSMTRRYQRQLDLMSKA